MSKAKRTWPKHVFDESGKRYEICTTEEFREMLRPIFEEAWGISLPTTGAKKPNDAVHARNRRPRQGDGSGSDTATVGRTAGKRK